MTFDEHLQRALETFTSRLREEVTQQARVVGDELAAAARADQMRAEQAQVPPEPPPSTGRLAESVRTMSGARSLSEVLDTLVSCAAQEAPRAGVLLVRGERFHGWRFLGFDPAFQSGDPLDIAREYAGVVEQAALGGTVASPGADGHEGAPVFAQLPPGRGCVAVPLSIGGQVVAVLYADAGQKEPGTLNPEPLEILTLFASQRLEALTAVKAARSLTAHPDAPASGDAADDHAAARRYARLLVSEIKLYHEAQVAEGRRERDLATRLGGEIARVRTLYEQRVPPGVREGTDYVHEELIRTLADGDASLLEVKSG